MGVIARFRGVDKKTYHKFENLVKKYGLNEGRAVSAAMKLYVMKHEKKTENKSDLWTKEIDKILYGAK